ncbi:lysophospholipid acyltransferase family protein [Mycoplasma sp. 1654_15]|uniref:lysophospholipid acyltransferase family protein n=1 Tax=Mycoplasma sp. 1654_15 TaxID=2725994 RepID=UPI0014495561|nr:lysophospholipid acyltransferase family protein [Mycoplasma sp. 1654_15]QJB71187.1 1-acyl-sn-glycerol-3-phosphate acyltransferase [Mycoplasma sp. 1654_15]
MIIKLKLVLWSWLWAYRINKIRSLSTKHIKKKKELAPYFRSSLILKYAKSLLKLFNVKVVIKGYENIQKTPAMIVANHASNADSLFVYLALEKQNKDEQDKENVLTFLAKKELQDKKVTKWILQLIDTFFIDRQKIKESFATLVDFGKFVREKKTYGVVFPEGTRTEDGNIQNFKIGAFKIAKKNYLPIIPITINNSGAAFDTNRKEKLTVEVIIHKPIKATFVSSQPAEALALKSKNIIEQSYIINPSEKQIKKARK